MGWDEMRKNEYPSLRETEKISLDQNILFVHEDKNSVYNAG